MRPRARKCLKLACPSRRVLRTLLRMRPENLMFDSLSERLGGILDRLTGRGALSEADVDVALREVRRALLEADVALDVVRTFTEQVKTNAVGVALLKSVKPG